MVLIACAPLFFLLSCAQQKRSAGSTLTAEPTTRSSTDARREIDGDVTHISTPPTLDAGAPARPIFQHCVLHTGETTSHTRKTILPGGVPAGDPPDTLRSCWMNAECVREQGRAAPTDGNVNLECKGTQCVCTLAPLAPGAAPVTFSFAHADPCATPERPTDLLIDQCMRGMPPPKRRRGSATQ